MKKIITVSCHIKVFLSQSVILPSNSLKFTQTISMMEADKLCKSV